MENDVTITSITGRKWMLEVPMDFGAWGEEVACRYLKRQGYKILDRNFRCKRGEVDIVATKGKTLCFVEVKSRQGLSHGFPSEAVTLEKQRHLRNAAMYYLHTHPGVNKELLRMDVIEVLKIQGKPYVRHIEDAF